MTTDQIAAAFAAGKEGRCHNAHTDGKTYALHTSAIAVHTDKGVVFYWHGFYTRTTAAHMNAILYALGASFRVSYAEARDNETTDFVWEK